MIKYYQKTILMIIFCLPFARLMAQASPANTAFQVSMDNPETHIYHVIMRCKNSKKANQDFKMCAWTPGFYELIDYAKAVENFRAVDTEGKEISSEKTSKNTWRVHSNYKSLLTVSYDVKATTSFVGNVYLDENRGYITPGGLFLYTDEALQKPLTVKLIPYRKWSDLVATGLDSIAGRQNTFYAANFDVLFDSPFLMGKLQALPSFTVKSVPHYFIGYDLGDFDGQKFMADLKKVIISASNIIGDIPYTHYTFLAIGPGAGGIEHLNSTSISLPDKKSLLTAAGRQRFYSFLAHEYFHNYNVKRIHPIELGPFDYSKENLTNMLWVSEGFTDYYEYLILKDAGMLDEQELLKAYQTHIQAYENKPGHLLQSATQSSYETWAGNPFTQTPETAAKTISYYDKGCILGLMIDFKIRHETSNKRSLDDVMRALYKTYYRAKKRGFTEKEFQQQCEKIAGVPLTELFEYASTVKSVNYLKYFTYAGLNIDTTSKALPGKYTGLTVLQKDTSLVITAVDWNSAAWKAGLRPNDQLLKIDQQNASSTVFNNFLVDKNSTDHTLNFTILRGDQTFEIMLKPSKKYEKKFVITRNPNPTSLQAEIYKSWMRN